MRGVPSMAEMEVSRRTNITDFFSVTRDMFPTILAFLAITWGSSPTPVSIRNSSSLARASKGHLIVGTTE